MILMSGIRCWKRVSGGADLGSGAGSSGRAGHGGGK